MKKYPRIIGWLIVGGFWLITGCALEAMKNSAIHQTHDIESGKLYNTTEDTIVDLGCTR